MKGNALVLTLCSVTGEMHNIDEDNVCTGCGSRVEDPIKGDKDHKSSFSGLELRGRMRSMGYTEVVSLLEPDDEIEVVKTGQRFRCALTSEEVDRILVSVSFSGLGMYSLMCEYEPGTRFTIETLASLASNSREETQAILNALFNASYVFREDAQEEGMPIYSVNREMLPDSVSGSTIGEGNS